jgi:hypothetical protein
MNWNQLRRLMRKRISADFEAHRQLQTPVYEAMELILGAAMEELIDTTEDIVEERLRKLESWKRRKTNASAKRPFVEKDSFESA